MQRGLKPRKTASSVCLETVPHDWQVTWDKFAHNQNSCTDPVQPYGRSTVTEPRKAPRAGTFSSPTGFPGRSASASGAHPEGSPARCRQPGQPGGRSSAGPVSGEVSGAPVPLSLAAHLRPNDVEATAALRRWLSVPADRDPWRLTPVFPRSSFLQPLSERQTA